MIFPSNVVVALICLLSFTTTRGQSTQREWTAMDFHNPLKNAIQCGFPNNYPSYICDPNGILGDDLTHINWLLSDVANNGTHCPCSTYFCETKSGKKGYKIGVALVQKMKELTSADGKAMSLQDMAQKFAHELKTLKWKFGYCEEDIIIFYSVDDKMLSIYTGRTAGMKLTPYYRDLLAYKVGPRFNDGRIAEALNVLILDIKVILNCDAASTSDCSLYDRSIEGFANTIQSSSTLIILATSLLMLLFRH